jgi:hypothetical protein
MSDTLTPERLGEIERWISLNRGALAYVGFEDAPLLLSSLRAAWAERDALRAEVARYREECACLLRCQRCGALDSEGHVCER